MKLTEHLSGDRRGHVEARLRSNLMAWLTTVSPAGKPESVPVWFLLREDDETILIYSQPGKPKLRYLQQNPQVALGLDVTDLGRDIIRIDGEAREVPEVGPADQEPNYRAKYAERIGALFGDAERFAAMYSVPLLITPRRLRALSLQGQRLLFLLLSQIIPYCWDLCRCERHKSQR
jgi:PPOX class probable F420-dependent enzyme